MEDNRNILRDKAPFSYQLTGHGKALIFHQNKMVYTAVGKDYQKLQRAILTDDEYQIQLCMAKITGHFKHGNERR